LHDSRDAWEQQVYGERMPPPTGQDKPKY
jgi:hypothetical protein